MLFSFEIYLWKSSSIRPSGYMALNILFISFLTFELEEIQPPLTAKIKEVLEASDLAKFAKWRPEAAKVLDINQKSKQIIEEASPKEAVGGI